MIIINIMNEYLTSNIYLSVDYLRPYQFTTALLTKPNIEVSHMQSVGKVNIIVFLFKWSQ